MAKRSAAPVTGSVSQTQDKLSALLKAADPGLSNSDEALANKVTFVPENIPLIPDENIKQALATASLAQNSGAMGVVAKQDPGYANTLRNIESAMHHTEKISTVATSIGVGRSSITMPPSVRDIPNSLYFVVGHDGQHHYVRERADRLMEVLYGDVAPRLQQGARRGGYDRKPLVWSSQVLWFKFFTAPETLDDLTFETEFSAAEIEHSSVIHQALSLCMEQMTISQIARFAKHGHGSVLEVLRKVMDRILDENEITCPTKQETEASNEQIEANRRPL